MYYFLIKRLGEGQYYYKEILVGDEPCLNIDTWLSTASFIREINASKNIISKGYFLIIILTFT